MVVPANRQNVLKVVHFLSTLWFILSAGCLLVLALRQAGFHWWVIFSLSGYSTLIAFLLISLYLFAIFRGVARSQKVEIEHPLTSSAHYLFFYDISPFLGAIAGGLVVVIDTTTLNTSLQIIVIGSLFTTFLVWIIVDPAVGLAEMMIPASLKHRRERIARTKAERAEEQLTKQRLLAEIETKEQQELAYWRESLQPYADKLAVLIASQVSDERIEAEVVEMGLNAWRIGGLGCMRNLHSMTMEKFRQKCTDNNIIDYISIWWDGVGTWRNLWMEGNLIGSK